MSLRRLPFFVLFFVIASYTLPVLAVADRELTARKAADSWLLLIDEGRYAEAFNEAAPELRQSIKPREWAQGLIKVRQPLGAVSSRQLQRLFPTTVLPGNIEGDFVVVNYRTRFEGRKEPANEILVLTPINEDDSDPEAWKVTSFFLE